MPMHITHQQEAFSKAYVQAIGAAAGYRVQDGPIPDDDSVDLTLSGRGPSGTLVSPKLDVQLKCQLGQPPDDDAWPFDLKVKNYNDLCTSNVQVPRILVVVCVPEVVTDWTKQERDHMFMRHCAWWLSLRDQDASDNETKVRVRIPKVQVFDVESLEQIMQAIGHGGAP